MSDEICSKCGRKKMKPGVTYCLTGKECTCGQEVNRRMLPHGNRNPY